MTNYRDRLFIEADKGSLILEFFTSENLLVAEGYQRIVIGERGPYIEFKNSMMKMNNLHVPKEQEYRLTDQRVYYVEFRTNDKSNVKVYFQRRTVKYADYRIGFFYVSPFELKIMWQGQLHSIIDPLK